MRGMISVLVYGWCIPLLTAADQPLPMRVLAPPLSVVENARRDALAQFGSGRIKARADDSVGAAKKLEAALKLDPDAVEPRRDLVAIYIDLGRDAAAIRTAREVLAKNPSDVDTAHQLANLLYTSHRFKDAADVLDSALPSPKLSMRTTKNLAILLDRARCRSRTDDARRTAEAWQDVRQFLESKQDLLRKDSFTKKELAAESAAAAEHHGRALIKLKKFGEASHSFKSAHAIFADPHGANDPAGVARSHWNLADLAVAQDQPEEAIKHYEAYLAFRPRNPEPYLKYAAALRLAGQDPIGKLQKYSTPEAQWVLLAEKSRTPAGFGEAHTEWSKLALQTDDPEFFHLLVKTYSTADSGAGLLTIAQVLFPATTENRARTPAPAIVPRPVAERRQAFASALVREPAFAVKMTKSAQLSSRVQRSAELWELLAWACSRGNHTEAVEAALRESFAADGQFRSFQRLQAHLSRQRKWQEVIDVCNSARNFGPGVLNFYRAGALAELERAEEALNAISSAEADNALAARREKIRILGILGRYEEMLKECNQALEEFRAPAEVRSLRYLRSDALLGLKRNREAEEELRGLLEDDADDALALNNLGYYMADQNRNLDEAEQLIRRAIEIEADDRARAGEPTTEHAAYLDSLGWVLFRKGQLDEARKRLERAAALGEGATDPTIWDHLGDVVYRLNDLKRAKEVWTVAEQLYATTHKGREGGRRAEVTRKLKLIK